MLGAGIIGGAIGLAFGTRLRRTPRLVVANPLEPLATAGATSATARPGDVFHRDVTLPVEPKE